MFPPHHLPTQVAFRPRHPLPRQKSIPIFPAPAWPWAAGQNALAVANFDTHPLQQYLPGLAQVMFQWNVGPETAARQFVQSSEDVYENGGSEVLTAEQLLTVYQSVIGAVKRYGRNGLETAVSSQILGILDATFGSEERRLGGLGDEDHSESLSIFLALSAISKQTQSRDLGDVLSAFFSANVDAILEQESVRVIALWARGVYRAEMRNEDKRACLREVLLRVPELPDVLERGAPRGWMSMAKALRRMQDELGLLDLRRVGNHRRREWDQDRDWLSPAVPRHRRGVEGRDRGLMELEDRIARPRSAPGERRAIARQALRVVEAAEEMQDEAERLRQIAMR